jgi:hypothetical protein
MQGVAWVGGTIAPLDGKTGMTGNPRGRRDLRRYARSTQARLIAGGLALLVIVGNGLIALVYGRQAAMLALLCTAAGLAPVILIVAWLWLLDWIAKRSGNG